MQVFAGVDLGGSTLDICLVECSLRKIAFHSQPTGRPCTPCEIANRIAQTIKRLLAAHNILQDNLSAVGLGVPGSVNLAAGVITKAPNLGWENVSITEMVSKQIEYIPVVLENDANAALRYEMTSGVACGIRNAVLVTIGTGIGSGIAIDGKIYNGSGGAVECGHTVIVANGLPCSCGRLGCLEMYASATALIRMTKEAMESNRNSAMWQLVEARNGEIRGDVAFQAAKSGDSSATAVLNQYLDYLSLGVVNLINVFQPQMLIIGGGVAHAGGELLEPIKARALEEAYLRGELFQTEIVSASCKSHPGAVGAAICAIQHFA
jgi:glucokinase